MMNYKMFISAVVTTLAFTIGCAEQDAQQPNAQMNDVKTVALKAKYLETKHLEAKPLKLLNISCYVLRSKKLMGIPMP
jgi:outer membrane lipoprotein-sorting protein